MTNCQNNLEPIASGILERGNAPALDKLKQIFETSEKMSLEHTDNKIQLKNSLGNNSKDSKNVIIKKNLPYVENHKKYSHLSLIPSSPFDVYLHNTHHRCLNAYEVFHLYNS